jgi:DNA modification methylase
MEYSKFLENKIIQTPKTGFPVRQEDINPMCFPHQKDCIQWAADGGNRALFMSFGTGKTVIQVELERLCLQQFGGKGLIVCPLGVKQEFKKDAKMLGVEVEYCRNMEEVRASKASIILTNYERVRDGNIDPNYFTCASLDEASVLRSFGSKTYQTFLTLFKEVRFKWVCTATPSPNRFKELIHYAGFLGVMDTGQALTRFFKRDSTKANNLTLYPHKEREFWLWMSSWAIFLTKPSDLGYSDEGYDLPPLKIHYHRVTVDVNEANVDRDGTVKMFRDAAIDLSTASKEKRLSLPARLQKAVEIIQQDKSDKHWIVWHHLEDERKAIQKAVDCKAIYGSQKDDDKESLLIAFGEGEYRILATKPIIAGSGCNFQKHCHSNIYMGIDYKFNDFIQSLHRTQRFQQKHTVEAHIIYTDSEDNVLKELEEKWKRHNELVDNMTKIIKKYGLSNQKGMSELKRSIGIERKEVKGQNFTAVHNDCVQETSIMEENSVDLIVTSIPFSNHYEYTPSYNDFGHTNDDAHFFGQMDYLTPQLIRVLKPGRVAAIHVKDRIMFGNVTGMGMPTVNPFHAKTIFHFMQHGFAFFGQITIETDVVRENNQTYRLGWSEQCKDGSKMGVGCPEYLLLFRKLPTDTSNAYADVPVTKTKEGYQRGRWQIDARGKWNSSGNRLLTPEEFAQLNLERANKRFAEEMKREVYDYHRHVDVAVAMENANKLPATFETFKVPARYDYVWSDVNRMRTLNTNQSQSREQNHVCPLQFDIVERAIERWSNPGELVFDPFGGLMTVPYCALKMGRKGYASELNPDYFRYGVKYLKEVEYKKSVPSLFDSIAS